MTTKTVIAAAKKDQNDWTDLQYYISTVDTDEEKHVKFDDNSIEVISPFYYPRKVFSYSSICREQLKSDDTKYVIKDYYHYLRFVYLTLKLPNIALLPEYDDLVQICWTRNLFHSIIGKGFTIEFIGDNDKLLFSQTINKDLLDEHRSSNINNIEWYDQDIGNRPELTKWDNELITDEELVLVLPFFFSKATNMAIPVYKLSTGSPGIKILFRSDFELNLDKLIRMRVRKDLTSKWVDLPVPELSFLNIYKNRLSKPKLWVEYSIQDEDEANTQLDDAYSVIITDYIYNEEVELKNDSPLHIKIHHEKSPIKYISFSAENYKSSYFNSYSNYTTDHKDLTLGKDPIKYSYIRYNSTYRVLKLSSIHSSRLTRERYFNGRCNDKGYHNITFSYNPYANGPDSHCVPDTSAELGVQLNGMALNGQTIIEDKYKTHRKSYIDREWDKKTPSEKISHIITFINEQFPEILLDDSLTYKYIIKSIVHVFKVIHYEKGNLKVIS